MSAYWSCQYKNLEGKSYSSHALKKTPSRFIQQGTDEKFQDGLKKFVDTTNMVWQLPTPRCYRKRWFSSWQLHLARNLSCQHFNSPPQGDETRRREPHVYRSNWEISAFTSNMLVPRGNTPPSLPCSLVEVVQPTRHCKVRTYPIVVFRILPVA